MAKKKVTKPQALENVEMTLTKTERYLEENYRVLLILLGIIVGVAALVWLSRLFFNKRDADAHAQMFQAELYFETDSMSLALNGDGNYLGFLDIISSYKGTKASNLAAYYSGIAYIRLGDYENAIKYLEKYKKKDKVLGATATGALGDAWVELGEPDKGVRYYMDAAAYSDNEFLTPIFLMKAAMIYESQEDYGKAIEIYQRLIDDYPLTSEGTASEKHLARVRLLAR